MEKCSRRARYCRRIRAGWDATTVGVVRKAIYRWFSDHVWAGDGILGGLLLATSAVNALDYRHSEPIASVLLLVSAAPVFLRRSAPEFAFTLGAGLLALNLWLLDSPTFAVVLAPVLVHSCVAHARNRSWGRASLAVGLIGALVAPLRWGYQQSDGSTLAMAVGLCAVSVIAAFVIGERQRDRQDHQAEQLRVTAERAAMLAAERDQRARIAAATERTRIARELHDIVAHSLSVVIVQADGAAAAVAGHPELATTVLRTISETSREALSQMRRLVGVLRMDPAETGTYAPAQGVADLHPLVEQVRQAGIDVELQVRGTELALPPGLDLTIFRLVQEALTNVVKHAGPAAAATVEVTYQPGSVRVAVSDDGRGAATDLVDGAVGAPESDGHGLLGMRERVWLQGGRLQIGPQAGGGFRVEAWFELPMQVAAPRWDPL